MTWHHDSEDVLRGCIRCPACRDPWSTGWLNGWSEVLFKDPPKANFCTTRPCESLLYDGVWLPAHRPAVIRLAACTSDPAITGGDRRAGV